MTGKTYCVSDIHGCYEELCKVLNKLNLKPKDTLIFMGDYVDRGPDSKSVIEKIIELQSYCNVITLKGNHEDMMYKALTDQTERNIFFWVQNGGMVTLQSYGKLKDVLDRPFDNKILKSHIDFIETLKLYHETDTHIFVHASPGLGVPLKEQPEAHLIWRRPQEDDEEFNYSHISGKTIISGHTAQASGVPLKLSDKNILIDTGCFFTGILTVYNVTDDLYITNK